MTGSRESHPELSNIVQIPKPHSSPSDLDAAPLNTKIPRLSAVGQQIQHQRQKPNRIAPKIKI